MSNTEDSNVYLHIQLAHCEWLEKNGAMTHFHMLAAQDCFQDNDMLD